MSDNKRTRREAKITDGEPAESQAGHDIADVGARRENRDSSLPESTESESTEVRRTQRSATESNEDEATSRRSRTTSGSGSATSTTGNTSETGASSPATDARRTSPQVPGKPPMGCTSTSALLLITGMVGLVTGISHLIRR